MRSSSRGIGRTRRVSLWFVTLSFVVHRNVWDVNKMVHLRNILEKKSNCSLHFICSANEALLFNFGVGFMSLVKRYNFSILKIQHASKKQHLWVSSLIHVHIVLYPWISLSFSFIYCSISPDNHQLPSILLSPYEKHSKKQERETKRIENRQ